MSHRKWIKQKDVSEGIIATVANLLIILQVKSTLINIRKVLKSHPDFPSLLSISETLNEWGIKTEAVRVTVDDLSKEDFPGIAYLKSGEFVVLKEITNGKIQILHPKNGYSDFTLEAFSGIWSGVILRVFSEDAKNEENYNKNKSEEIISSVKKYLTLIGFPFLILLAFFLGLKGVEKLNIIVPLFFLKAVGVALCGIMVSGHLGNLNIVENICHSGKRLNCHRVMNSPAGRILGIPMADIGLLYFGGGVLTLLISLFSRQIDLSLHLLSFLNVLCLPYTLFSLIYQAFVIQSWCWMCLTVQAIFWLEFYFLSGFLHRDFSNFSFNSSTSFSFGFLFIILFWIFFRHIYVTKTELKRLELENIRMRQDPNYIQSKIETVQRVDVGTFPFEIVTGSKEAPVNFILVVNPLCGYCWKAYIQMKRIIRSNQRYIKGIIRFLVRFDDEKKTKTEKLLDYEVSKRIMSLAMEGKDDILQEALSDWFSPKQSFSKGRFKRWLDKYSTEISDQKEIDDLLKKHKEWALSCSVDAVPTAFLNNFRIPSGTNIEDLKYFLLRQIRD